MKPTLLILHGALGDQQQMAPLQRLLSENFETYNINFPGHGGRKMETDNLSIAHLRDDVANFLINNGLSKINIFGYSMGGYVALELARKHPESVNKIFTLGTKLNWTPEIAAKEIRLLNPDKIEEKIPAFANVLKKRHAPLDWKWVMSQTAELMTNLGNGTSIKLEDFKNINHSTTIGIGDQDNMVSIEESKQVADMLPNGTLSIFKNTEHPFEKVDLSYLSKMICQFMAD
ncbi:alpha/beta fold hydrolase [Fulvivirgaceae bacterium BMA10]|uniref:Alpha/beta fold hydrolase n=1 Tax=Splendidivirga corallicola TaxID=3051826 RepID=A0ABT8KQ50_9BACT|nr:alpha/beta fold hydrolase [Fulvivirgaceae bacterium BMA10]